MNETLEYIVQKIVSGYSPDKIFLFGSYATDTVTNDSDLDLLVIKETQLPAYQRSREVRKLLYGLKMPLDLLIYTEKEMAEADKNKYSVIHQALKVAKLVYAKP